MKLSLVVMTAGKSKGQAIPINLPQFIIGRDPQCNLRPASAVISKRHCALLIKDGKASVRDFDSTNGTFINDVPVKGEASLKNDDILKLGPLEFKVVSRCQARRLDRPTPPSPKPAATRRRQFRRRIRGRHAAVVARRRLPKDAGEPTTPPEESEIPGGSTVMDLGMKSAAAETPAPDTAAPAMSAKSTPAVPAPKKPDPKNDPAHLAAKAILEKYNRRSR